jgi:hypothetical protein
MSEHMAGRMAGNVPTLTDHFKQALSMTRSQLQSGPSALASASQMGVNGINGSGTLNPIGSVPAAVHPNAALNTLANLNTRPDIVYGAGQGQGQGGLSNPAEHSNGFMEAIQSYGKWILLLIIIVAGVGAYFWWKKRQGKSKDNVSEEMHVPGRRPIHRTSGGMGGGLGTGMSITIVSGGGGNNVPPPPPPPSFNPSRFQPSSYQNPQSPQPMPENLRDNEQQGTARGAEFSNPSMVSHMMPMSTRVKPTEQTQNLPPQDISNPQPPRVTQPAQQPLPPPIQTSLPAIPPVSQPINPPINLPISQPPSHVPDLPISPQPTQPPQSTPPQPNVDPNFTVV